MMGTPLPRTAWKALPSVLTATIALSVPKSNCVHFHGQITPREMQASQHQLIDEQSPGCFDVA